MKQLTDLLGQDLAVRCAVIIGWVAVIDAEAQYLRTSSLQSLLKLRLGNPGRLPPPKRDFEASLNETERLVLAEFRSASAIGSPETVRAGLAAFIERTKADELMIVTSVYEHAARKRSFEIVSEVVRTL